MFLGLPSRHRPILKTKVRPMTSSSHSSTSLTVSSTSNSKGDASQWSATLALNGSPTQPQRASVPVESSEDHTRPGDESKCVFCSEMVQKPRSICLACEGWNPPSQSWPDADLLHEFGLVWGCRIDCQADVLHPLFPMARQLRGEEK